MGRAIGASQLSLSFDTSLCALAHNVTFLQWRTGMVTQTIRVLRVIARYGSVSKRWEPSRAHRGKSSSLAFHAAQSKRNNSEQ